MKKNLFVLLVLFVSSVSCENEVITSPTGTFIEGNISGVQGGELILVQSLMADEIRTIDTIIPDLNGDFIVGLNVPKIGFYRIIINNNNLVGLILQANDTIQFEADISDLASTCTITGSEESMKLKTFDDLLNNYVLKIDSLNGLVAAAKSNQYYNELTYLMNIQNDLQSKTGQKIRAFVKQNNTYLASLSAVQKLDPEGDFELFELVRDGLKSKIGGTEVHTNLSKQIENWRQSQIGGTLLDITLKNPSGEPITLYNQLGELTLVDFWASWCRPCRAENPNVVKAYNKFKSKGFTVVGISLDEDVNRWKSAIKLDGLNWVHMSDLKQWNSLAVQTYNINGIPASFLVDKNGKIVGKNLRGPALELKISQLLDK